MAEMKECEIDSVRVSLTNQDRVVVLKDKGSERYLPIWIGLFESEALTIALQGVQTARPLTHDLLLATIQALDAQFIRVEIISIEEDVYYAQLVLLVAGKQVNVDCRPSDALVLMVRAHVPIFISEEILAKSAIQPEDREPYDFSALDSGDEELGDDLSVFSEFLASLEADAETKDPESSSEDESAETKDHKEPEDDKPDTQTHEQEGDDVDSDDDFLSDDELDDLLFGPTINNN